MLVEQPPRPERPTPSMPFVIAPDQLADLAALRLMLEGESSADLPRLWFADKLSVDAFLRLSEFDTDNPIDIDRLHELHHDAVAYLTETQNYRLPPQLDDLEDIHDLFLAASNGPPRLRRYACMLLKVMHILHHIAGRELMFNTAISEAQLLSRLSAKVFNVIDRMRVSGVGIQEFAAGQKSRTSLVTKLLAKRSTLATHIFDKLRFRIIVNTRDDLVAALLYLVHNLFPFNYIRPEQSQNGVLTFDDLGRNLGLAPELVRAFWEAAPMGPELGRESTLANEFSGKGYRAVNFVADIPLRVDDVAPEATPAIVFVQTEIQVIDAETEKNNQRGENSHALYKKRQRERVRKRLEGPENESPWPFQWPEEPA
jgi:uncharacterized protein (TIGR04552 family)